MKKSMHKSAVMIWHQRIGAVAAALVVVLALSGLALNHSTALGLNRQHLNMSWLMRWYGLAQDETGLAYQAGEHWVMGIKGGIYLDGELLPHRLKDLAGAVATDQMLIVAGRNEILLLAQDGALIERIAALPGPVLQLGLTQDRRIAIATPQERIFSSGAEMLDWRPDVAGGAQWSQPVNSPEHLLSRASADLPGVSLERLLLDVHSGRILGQYGPWLMDGAAVLLLGLAASGIYGWLNARNANGNGNGDAS